MKVGILDLEGGVHLALKMGHWIHGVLEMMVPGVAGDPELSPLVRTNLKCRRKKSFGKCNTNLRIQKKCMKTCEICKT